MFSMLPLLAYGPTKVSHYVSQVSPPLSAYPLHSSPLAPRDGHTPQPPRRRLPMSSPTSTKNRKENPYSRRVTKSNPLIHNRGDGRETRRNLFLKKVREDSEDKRWDARGGDDEMMRTVWIADGKRRAERQAREASYLPASHEEEELEEDRLGQKASNTSQSKDAEMVDEVVQREEAEIEAFLSMMETEVASDHPELYERSETLYGSDDEEYDHIFLNVIREEIMSHNARQGKGDITKSDQDPMDTS